MFAWSWARSWPGEPTASRAARKRGGGEKVEKVSSEKQRRASIEEAFMNERTKPCSCNPLP